jgi:hypothetical protein
MVRTSSPVACQNWGAFWLVGTDSLKAGAKNRVAKSAWKDAASEKQSEYSLALPKSALLF